MLRHFSLDYSCLLLIFTGLSGPIDQATKFGSRVMISLGEFASFGWPATLALKAGGSCGQPGRVLWHEEA